MYEPKVKDTKVVFGPCRLSYTHLFQKHSFEGAPGEGQYMTNILIPKTEKATVKALKEAIEAAKNAGITGKWGGKLPKNYKDPLRDGDEREDDVYAGHYYLNAKCNTRPGIVDRSKEPIVDEEEIYSGVWAVASVTFFPFAKGVNNGVSCGLNNIMKYKDDDRLGGRTSAANDFADFEDEDDL